MEYLMTYGWAILIIAVVLGAIYSLGLFNGTSLAPRAQPGSCQVLRPNGPGTVQYISLAGACTNELPQYTAQFNGATSKIVATGYPAFNGLTVSVWFNYYPGISAAGVFAFGSSGGFDCCAWRIGNVNNLLLFDPGDGNPVGGHTLSTYNWYNVVFTAQNSGANTVYAEYFNGALDSSGTHTGYLIQSPTSTCIGMGNNCAGNNFNGSIANVQIYNTTLDANSVKALYQSGIGGAPVNLQSLVAWYPLNGNANDYSGNLNNGVPTSVVYTNQWLTGYTVP